MVLVIVLVPCIDAFLLSCLLNTFPCTKVDDHSCPNPMLQSDLFLHEPQSSSGPQAHHHHSRWRRRRRGVAFKADPECRVMSLTTFPLAGAFSPCHGDLLRGKHYLAVACSDGIIRSDVWCRSFLILSNK